LFSGVSVLATVWFLGLTFSAGPIPEVSRLIKQSSILHVLDLVFPRPPPFMSGVQGALASAPYPPIFSGLEQPILPSSAPLPSDVNTAGVRTARNAVYKVEGRGCGGIVSGSAYPIAANYLVTNAHVVAGTTGTVVSQDGVRPRPAVVVLFD